MLSGRFTIRANSPKRKVSFIIGPVKNKSITIEKSNLELVISYKFSPRIVFHSFSLLYLKHKLTILKRPKYQNLLLVKKIIEENMLIFILVPFY